MLKESKNEAKEEKQNYIHSNKNSSANGMEIETCMRIQSINIFERDAFLCAIFVEFFGFILDKMH